MDTKFIKLGGELINTEYVKYIRCDDTDCMITVVNTKSGSSLKQCSHRDNTFKYNKYTLPTHYYKLKEFVDSQK